MLQKAKTDHLINWYIFKKVNAGADDVSSNAAAQMNAGSDSD